ISSTKREKGHNGDKLNRKIISYFANKMVNLSFHPQVRDATSGFRVYSKRAYKFLAREENIKSGYTGQVDILERLITQGFKCAEYPIAFSPRQAGSSKLRIRDMVDFFLFVLLKGNLMKYAAVGISGVLVNEFVLFLLHGFHPILADLVAIEVSITTNFFLNDLWTFRNRRKKYGIGRRFILHNFFSFIPGAVNFMFYFSLYLRGFEYLDANLLGIIAAYVVRYILSSSIVWGENNSAVDVSEEIAS
ncbi:MAG: GtrA family protein, partial [Candidatus Thermoplasmatota archaeon]|nr:GtrA family protein [Candidatus Thermoplasmatota archaeon]